MQKFLKDWALLWVYLTFIISPQVMYYLTNSFFSPALIIIIVSQFSLFILLAALVRRIQIFYLLTSGLFLLAGFQWGHFSVFKHELTGGAVASILLTDPHEAAAFLALMPKWLVFLFILLLGLLIFVLGRDKRKFVISRKTSLLFVLLFLSHFGFRVFKDTSVKQALIRVFHDPQTTRSLLSVKEGIRFLREYSENMKSYRPAPVEMKVTGSDYEKLIVVIGESVRRKNWQLYGYFRDTNKHLKAIENELVVFKDVVSASNNTIQSLRYALSYQQDKGITTIFDVAKAAGYHSHWISNQAKFGIYDNATTVLAHRAETQVFLNTDSSTISYDEKVLPRFEEALSQPGKRLIILHFMGSHYYYNRRYPPLFDQFKDTKYPEGMYVEPDPEIVNSYDNSIYYTDFLLEKIISMLKMKQEKVGFIYFADHGERLFDKKGYLGHGSPIATREGLEIPMVWWSNQPEPRMSSIRNKSLSLYDFLPSFSHLMGVELDLPDRSDYFSDRNREKRPYMTTDFVPRYYEDL